MAQLLWLISNQRFTSTVCHVVAAIQHYLFLVSFVAMAIIACDTYSAFASKDVPTERGKKRENKKFLKYSAIVWGLPAMFVAACALVDQQDVYAVYVNEQWCFFNNAQAQKYLFVLPVGLLLLFNVISILWANSISHSTYTFFHKIGPSRSKTQKNVLDLPQALYPDGIQLVVWFHRSLRRVNSDLLLPVYNLRITSRRLYRSCFRREEGNLGEVQEIIQEVPQ